MQTYVSPDGTAPRWAWTEGLASDDQLELSLPMDWPTGAGRDRAAADLLRYVADYITEAPATDSPTPRIAAGETLAFGWTTLRFRASKDEDGIGPGLLVIQELAAPFGAIEDGWVDGADQAVELLHVQMSTKRRNYVAGEIDFPHRQDQALVCTRVPPAGFLWHYPLFAERADHEAEGESGWFLACYAQDHDHENPHERQSVALHELVAAFPRLFPYLALPMQTSVIFEENQVVIFRPDDEEGYLDPAEPTLIP